ncbi:hypothetical protein MMC13_007174 [Lambiella insularis]|nr:hypothetical protein [Lambiella insularis]
MPSLKSPPRSPPVPSATREDEEDDYMSMAIAEPTGPRQKETYTQRRIRKSREAEIKSRTPSKAELQKISAQTLDTALSRPVPQTSKGFQMLSNLGYKPGSTLGAPDNSHARKEPLELAVKEDRGGIGLDSERKRKFREEAEGEMERERAEEGGYRDRVAKEREERRKEGLVRGAMSVLEGLEGSPNGVIVDPERDDREESEENSTRSPASHEAELRPHERRKKNKPTRQINVLWRGLVRQRETEERDRRMRYDLHQSLSRNPNYEDPEEDKHDRQAWGTVEEELDEEDPELQEFNSLEPVERLSKMVEYMRDKYHYCFWCKFRYPNEGMEGCPGLTEDDHD